MIFKLIVLWWKVYQLVECDPKRTSANETFTILIIEGYLLIHYYTIFDWLVFVDHPVIPLRTQNANDAYSTFLAQFMPDKIPSLAIKKGLIDV